MDYLFKAIVTYKDGSTRELDSMDFNHNNRHQITRDRPLIVDFSVMNKEDFTDERHVIWLLDAVYKRGLSMLTPVHGTMVIPDWITELAAR